MDPKDDIARRMAHKVNFDKAWEHYAALREILGVPDETSHEEFLGHLTTFLMDEPEAVSFTIKPE